MKIPRILIAGTNSGCGKTTIAAGVMSVLTRRGLKVQPYKVGPDYIDPMFHRFVTGRYSRNLDAWLLDPETLKGLFLNNAAGADIAVIEGVMGFYDGLGGISCEASTAHVAGIIRSPVVLVANAAGISLSMAALIKGYREFIPDNGIQAVIINHIHHESHYLLLKKVIEEHNPVKVIGYLPSMKELSLPSRHLGLVSLEEQEDLPEKMDFLVTTMENTIDFSNLLTIARQAPTLQADFRIPVKKGPPVKVGIARDKAFHFYYQDNLDLLEQLGAELIAFSPLHDPSLPADISGLYLGGGYPEVFARELQNNFPMRRAIKARIDDGIPAYAECGGLMYLSDAIIDSGGVLHEMCGVFPATCRMTAALQRFGYVSLTMTADNLFGEKGDMIRAHEFHYSTMQFKSQSMAGDYCYQVSKKKARGPESVWPGGLRYKNTLAGYPHLHFWANPRLAGKFIQKCREYQRSNL
jgi:cobyrinic acid a,c-diamide synthase